MYECVYECMYVLFLRLGLLKNNTVDDGLKLLRLLLVLFKHYDAQTLLIDIFRNKNQVYSLLQSHEIPSNYACNLLVIYWLVR